MFCVAWWGCVGMVYRGEGGEVGLWRCVLLVCAFWFCIGLGNSEIYFCSHFIALGTWYNILDTFNYPFWYQLPDTQNMLNG